MSACDNITFFFRPRFKCQLLSTLRSFSVNLLRVSLCQHYILLFVDPFSVLAFDNVTFFLHTRFALSICPLHTVSASTFCVSAFVHIMFFVRTRVFMAALVLIMFFLCPRFLCLCQHCIILYVHVLHVHFVRVTLFLCPVSTFCMAAFLHIKLELHNSLEASLTVSMSKFEYFPNRALLLQSRCIIIMAFERHFLREQ